LCWFLRKTICGSSNAGGGGGGADLKETATSRNESGQYAGEIRTRDFWTEVYLLCCLVVRVHGC
jgi:hypothetical protein